MKRRLTNRERLFINEYFKDYNATAAFIRAGYAVKYANTNSSIVFNRPEVQEEIKRIQAEKNKRIGLSKEKVLNELCKIAFLDPSNIVDFKSGNIKDNANSEDLAAISQLKVEIDRRGNIKREYKFNDKIKALELLGKNLNLYTDKVDVNGSIPVVIKDNIE